MNQLEKTLTSLEVSEMVGREHNEVLKDIRRIIGQLGKGNLPQSYFQESTYVNSQNRTMPRFLLTKKGCELYSTRMTGEKGTQFAVAYIERFNEMENHIKENQVPQVSQTELIAMMAQSNLEQEKKLNEVDQRVGYIEKTTNDIKEIFSLTTINWRKEVNRIINKVAQAKGGAYKSVRNRTYNDLEIRAKCDLNRRLENMKSRAAEAGADKKELTNLNYLDVIERDNKLVEIYLAIVKELAIKNGFEFDAS